MTPQDAYYQLQKSTWKKIKSDYCIFVSALSAINGILYCPLCLRLINMRSKLLLFFETDTSFAAEFLEAHNEYRMLHGAPPLTLDPNLNCSAQAWADNLLEIRTLKHSDTNLGENLYYKYSCPPITITGN